MGELEFVIHCTTCKSSDISEMLVLSDHARIMHCRNCKNAFTYPKPTIPDYSSQDFQAGKGETQSLTLLEQLPREIEESYNTQLSIIEKNIPTGSAVLEIGGGEGIFLDMVKKAGYDVELIEPSVSAARRAQIRGLNVQNDYFQSRAFNRKYSLVCMAHVLEHMDDPLAVIAKIKSLLEPGGFILLTQTNFKGFMPMFLKANWYAWVPDQHFTHFSISGLKYIAKKSSLSVAEFKYSRLVHGRSIYQEMLKYIPFLQDQIHILLQRK